MAVDKPLVPYALTYLQESGGGHVLGLGRLATKMGQTQYYTGGHNVMLDRCIYLTQLHWLESSEVGTLETYSAFSYCVCCLYVHAYIHICMFLNLFAVWCLDFILGICKQETLM